MLITLCLTFFNVPMSAILLQHDTIIQYAILENWTLLMV